jgi:hypothetical protein
MRSAVHRREDRWGDVAFCEHKQQAKRVFYRRMPHDSGWGTMSTTKSVDEVPKIENKTNWQDDDDRGDQRWCGHQQDENQRHCEVDAEYNSGAANITRQQLPEPGEINAGTERKESDPSRGNYSNFRGSITDDTDVILRLRCWVSAGIAHLM